MKTYRNAIIGGPSNAHR